MTDQPKIRTFIIIIGFLLIANIVMLALFISGDHRTNKPGSGKDSFTGDFLRKEVGFNSSQMDAYDSLSKRHRDEMRSTFSRGAAQRKKNFELLSKASFSDSAIDAIAGGMHEQQSLIETNMLRHLKNIRSICTTEQLQRFDTGFYKIFGRRAETHKEK